MPSYEGLPDDVPAAILLRRNAQAVLRVRMPGNLFEVRDDEYYYQYITDAPIDRMKELVREALIAFDGGDGCYDSFDDAIEDRFDQAGYFAENLFNLTPNGSKFDAEDDF